jgi:hypothetical protein
MQNFGRYTLSTYLSPASPLEIDVGLNWGYIRLINNSPYLLKVDFSGQGTIDHPEMYLEDYVITPSFRGKITITPSINLNNAQYSPSFILSVNAYLPGEIASPQAQPMTFLSNVGNTVNTNTMGTNTLSNEGNPINTEVIDIGTPTNSKLVDIFNDHFTWSVEQSSVKHQVLKGQTSGNPLQLGQAGDKVQILGAISNEGQAANTEMLDFGTTTNANTWLVFNDHFTIYVEQAGVLHQVLNGQSAGKPLQLGQAGDNSEVLGNWDVDGNFYVVGRFTADNGASFTDGNGGWTMTTLVCNGNIQMPNNTTLQMKDTGNAYKDILYVDANNDTDIQAADSGKAVRFKTSDGTSRAHVDSNGITLDTGKITLISGTFARIGGLTNTSCGSGTTINHGLGTTPGILVATPELTQAGSATVGVGNIGGTSFQATVGAGTNISWCAMNGS